MEYIILVFIFILIIPGTLTIWNIYNLFAKNKFKPKAALGLTMGIGLIYYLLFYSLLWETAGDYYEVINSIQYHYPIATQYCISFVLPIVLGFTGLLIIGVIPAGKLSPLVSATAAACIVIGNVMGTFFAIQIWNEKYMPEIMLFYLFHFNMLLLSINHIHMFLDEQIRILNMRNTLFRYPWMQKLYLKICSIQKLRKFYFIMIFPVAGILIIILILFGQGPDGFIKAFTMTADWKFSTQIPPPPVLYQGHYLCTVAAGGHRKVVKPLRYGRRNGAVIVVNRQLCIANAFEDLIHEKMPKFHKKVRDFYDCYGYPVSKFITTPLKADFVYFIMKPLEWIFLVVLYLFDVNPEKRISEQYL